ncbi:hypothetical protein C0J50_11869, partial [Silurus asotus]
MKVLNKRLGLKLGHTITQAALLHLFTGEMSISQYVTELKLRAKSCEFGQLQESLIRDRVVCGITSDAMRERLMREVDITLKKAIQICITSETTKAQILQMHDEERNAQTSARETKHVDAVKHKQTRSNAQKNKNKVSEKDKASKFRCNMLHDNCPAYGKHCKNCEKMNHFAKMCRSKKVHMVDEDDVTDQRPSLFVGMVLTQPQTDEWTAELKIARRSVKFKLDTGAQANVIPYSLVQRLGKKNALRLTNVKLFTYTGDKIPVKEKCNLAVKYNDKTYVVEFIVVTTDAKAHQESDDIGQRNDVTWPWQDEQHNAFNNVKTLLTETPILRYYDVRLPVTVSVDSSKSRLGAVLLQKDKPVAYASRTLNENEQRYAQIKKEMLAVVFGMERFHQFVYGRSVMVESDHKPLEAIMKKPLSSAPARVQRLLMRLQKYQVMVQYKP